MLLKKQWTSRKSTVAQADGFLVCEEESANREVTFSHFTSRGNIKREGDWQRFLHLTSLTCVCVCVCVCVFVFVFVFASAHAGGWGGRISRSPP
jgi:hypothetical protein